MTKGDQTEIVEISADLMKKITLAGRMVRMKPEQVIEMILRGHFEEVEKDPFP